VFAFILEASQCAASFKPHFSVSRFHRRCVLESTADLRICLTNTNLLALINAFYQSAIIPSQLKTNTESAMSTREFSDSIDNAGTRVFISYAGEDRARFVEGFAAKLRSKGIDVWSAFSELQPGDSLIDKIFEEGLKNAQAVIIILSKNSVNKPWVREELNASMVKRIDEGSKLIPVVLDDCQVPECLRSTVRTRIEDFSNYDSEVDEIVDSIFEHRNKPPIGQPPLYTKSLANRIPGLTSIDNLLHKLICEIVIESNSYFVYANSLLERADTFQIPDKAFYESLGVLDHRGYIAATWFSGVPNVEGYSNGSITVTLFGFEEYAKAFIPNYSETRDCVALQIVNDNNREERFITQSLKQPSRLIRHILETLKQQHLIGFHDFEGRGMVIYEISPELKRRLNK